MTLKRYDFSKLKNWHSNRKDADKEIESLNNEAEGNPLFFFHGRWQGGSMARRLAKALGPEQRFISIGPHGMCGDEVPSTFEEMALDRLDVIRATQPHGPYRLGGHCNGALVAYEMTRLLVAAGEKIEYVVLVEPPTVNARPFVRFLYRSLSRFMRAFGSSNWSRAFTIGFMGLVWDYGEFALTRRSWRRQLEVTRKVIAERLIPIFTRRMGQKHSSHEQHNDAPNGAFELEERDQPLWQQYFRAAVIHIPEPLNVPTLLFTSNSNIHGERSFTYNGAAWKNINPSTEVMSLPGNHITSMALGCGIIATRLKYKSSAGAVLSQDRALDGNGAHEGPCVA